MIITDYSDRSFIEGIFLLHLYRWLSMFFLLFHAHVLKIDFFDSKRVEAVAKEG